MFRFKNIRYFYTKVQRKIKNFLLSDKSREFLVFLFFFFVSTGFWLLQTLKNDYETEFTIPLRLKIEINCFEHFNELGLVKIPFEMENSWFSGKCGVTTYRLNELLGTKLRALYQRKKGRDLFDLYVALSEASVDVEEIMRCYHRYMSFVVQQPPTYKQFINNMEEKMSDSEFLGDTQNLIRPEREFNPQLGYDLVRSQLIDRLQK